MHLQTRPTAQHHRRRYFPFWTKAMMIKVEFTYFTHNIQYLRLFYATFWTDAEAPSKRNEINWLYYKYYTCRFAFKSVRHACDWKWSVRSFFSSRFLSRYIFPWICYLIVITVKLSLKSQEAVLRTILKWSWNDLRATIKKF